MGGRDFAHQPAGHGIRLLRPARKGEPERPGAELFKPLRQVIESANGTFKSRLNLDSTTAAHPPASSSPASCSASSH